MFSVGATSMSQKSTPSNATQSVRLACISEELFLGIFEELSPSCARVSKGTQDVVDFERKPGAVGEIMLPWRFRVERVECRKHVISKNDRNRGPSPRNGAELWGKPAFAQHV